MEKTGEQNKIVDVSIEVTVEVVATPQRSAVSVQYY